MRPEHKSDGDPCKLCGFAAARHRKRERNRHQYMADYMRLYDSVVRPDRYRYRPNQKNYHKRCQERIIGIDGEGQGRNPHKYVFLAASDEHGKKWSVSSNGKALSTEKCFDFILDLPQDSLIVAYAFQYDLTKILKDLPNNLLYDLFHEERRMFREKRSGFIRYRSVKWKRYKINYMNRRFSIGNEIHTKTVWDIFRFFQGKFTSALIDWKIGSKEQIKAMELMKEKRAIFDKLNFSEVEAYCFEECEHLAKLMRALIEAHKDVGLELKHFFGAGSTATAFLNKISIKKSIQPPPKKMLLAVASAFFGGRFENSIVGSIEKEIYSYDISSAYPYQTTFLPCLLHGKWEHRINPRIESIERSSLALVHWRLQESKDSNSAWGPFPVRSEDGTIAFPKSSVGGWCWKQEYLAGLKNFAGVSCSEAWLYFTNCDCQPFKDIPFYYNERCKLGKDAKGIVIKLGTNSIYGKLAQSKGVNPPYQCFIWAGNITSGTRAQLLECFSFVRNPWDILMFATDGVSSKVKLELPAPKDTGTKDTGKPLGGWEEKIFPSGIFCVRPGIYFPLNPTEEQLKEVKARGLGKRILYEQWDKIINKWDKSGAREPLTVEGITRFVGVKSGMSFGKNSGIKRSKRYGEWVPHEIKVSFSPRPKRNRILPDNRLELFRYLDYESVPYDAAMISPEVYELNRIKQVIEEQPDADLTDVSLGEEN